MVIDRDDLNTLQFFGLTAKQSSSSYPATLSWEGSDLSHRIPSTSLNTQICHYTTSSPSLSFTSTTLPIPNLLLTAFQLSTTAK